ncbi:MAG: hypothetical protein HQL87_11150, partial [Magnetococcales bacterium]|nr:hypothetical protein [Magnetococcales bacterium]
ADDASSIRAIAGAASIAASLGGTAGVSFSIGIALAHNEITNQVDAYIAHADQVVTQTGDVPITALSSGVPLFSVAQTAAGLTTSALDDATQVDVDDSSTPNVDEAAVDATGDAAILTQLVQVFQNQGVTLAGAVRLTQITAGERWLLAEENGGTYLIRADGDHYLVSRTNIDAMAVAASVSAAVGGAAGVAVSGGGSVASNGMVTKANGNLPGRASARAGRALIPATN